MTELPVDGLDEVIHQRYRLGILAYLSTVRRAEFTAIRAAVGLTDGNLSRHLTKLANAELIAVTKTATQGPRTWAELTPGGRTALNAHVRALRAILDQVDPL